MTMSFDSFGHLDRRQRASRDLAGTIGEFRSGKLASGGFLAFGNGRSYGDSCQNDEGLLVPMRPSARILDFDPQTGVLDVEAGCLLADIIRHVAGHGYFLPVTPGTQFVTVGGAIANDVHGKNHHRRGTFGCHIDSFDLLRSDGVIYPCSRGENGRFFDATIGGMGLTGIILVARLRLMRVGSLDIRQKVTPFHSLDDYFDKAEAADEANEYAVAWIDQLATGKALGRGVLITGNHADNGNFSTATGRLRLGVPFALPFSVLNRASLSLFNAGYFYRNSRKTEPHLTAYAPFFYPLDGISNWNRLYGPKGLYQHQSVIPMQEAARVIPAMLELTRSAGQSSFLTVLKRFGAVSSGGPLSFPQPGYTLTVDFPNKGPATLDLLSGLDRMTIEAGGRVNPYKDQRMSAEVFSAGFPRWKDLEEQRDPAFSSNFWRRTAMRLKQ